jgi:hypothetical protein
VQSATGTAVFSGAGLSVDAPASLPRGFELRNDLLYLMHEAAKADPRSRVTDEQLDELLGSERKLEVVLGRFFGAVDAGAANCLLALRLRVPNEAHLLSALHLAWGGYHATLNFDVGIEIAYDLLTSGAKANRDLAEPYRSALVAWRALAPTDAPTLRVVASHEEFDAWHSDGLPAALLKIHGSLSRDQTHLVDVVVRDFDEIGQLTTSRRAAVDRLGAARQLLITGYSGADPDVYAPLLLAAEESESTWRCLSLLNSSPVPNDLQSRRIPLVIGSPDGLATTALRDLLGVPAALNWPDQPLEGAGYRERIDHWRQDFRVHHTPDKFGVAWAWLLADGGDLDAAEDILADLAARNSADIGTLLRHAEVLYTRARGDDRDRAEQLYRRVAANRGADLGTRLMCRLRSGDISRGRAVRGGQAAVSNLARAFSQPLVVLVATRAGRRDQEAAADAYRALQHTSLRVLEQAAATLPVWSWPVLAQLCRCARLLGGPAERLSSNGNRRGLIRQHRLLLSAYALLLSRQPPPDELVRQTEVLRASYRSADDLPGSGNLAATLAVLAAAGGDLAGADSLVAEALDDYSAGRPDRRPIAAGEALVNTIERVLKRLQKQE